MGRARRARQEQVVRQSRRTVYLLAAEPTDPATAPPTVLVARLRDPAALGEELGLALHGDVVDAVVDVLVELVRRAESGDAKADAADAEPPEPALASRARGR